MNVGEYGNVLRVNLNEDISTRDNILELISPVPTVKKISITSLEGLSVGTENITVGEEVYLANHYLKYTIQPEDIFISGEWNIRVYSKASDNANNKITDKPLIFIVNP